MHARLIIKHLGLRYTKAYEVSEVSYFMLYFYGRVLVGTSVIMKTVMCEENNYLIKILCVGLALQSYHFIYGMVGILKQRIIESSERKRKGIKLRWTIPMTLEEI